MLGSRAALTIQNKFRLRNTRVMWYGISNVKVVGTHSPIEAPAAVQKPQTTVHESAE